MNKNILEFCNKYKEKLVNDMENLRLATKELDMEKPVIQFYVAVLSYSNMGYMRGDNSRQLFKLDDEDLRYLYAKYSKKLEEELNENIEAIKKMYGQV